MEPRLVTEAPDTGKVVIGHPLNESQVLAFAKREGTDYMLRVMMPPGRIYVMDMDALFDPPADRPL